MPPEASPQAVDMPPGEHHIPDPEPTLSQPVPAVVPTTASSSGFLRDLLARAKAKIQERKRNKLDKIMTKLATTDKITNDTVQKLLYVSDATATRYLTLLEREGKIKQAGITGKGVYYEKI